MIAGDPGESDRPAQSTELVALRNSQTVRRARIVKRIAQGDDPRGIVAGDGLHHPQQGAGGIIGRQELAAPGIGTAFLEMQIRENQGGMIFGEGGAGRIQQQAFAIHGNLKIPPLSPHASHPVSVRPHSRAE